MDRQDAYVNPLTTRYASPAMISLWSPRRKFSTWRRLWVALAEAQRALGLDISEAQIEELRAKVDDIDFEAARAHSDALLRAEVQRDRGLLLRDRGDTAAAREALADSALQFHGLGAAAEAAAVLALLDGLSPSA